MSKSLGNVLCPNVLAESYTEEGLRYFLLREGAWNANGQQSSRQQQIGLAVIELGAEAPRRSWWLRPTFCGQSSRAAASVEQRAWCSKAELTAELI